MPETDITWDEEHAAYRVLFERGREGMSSRLMLDTPMVTSAEYRELRARGQVLKAARSAAISTAGKEQERLCQSVVQVIETVKSLGQRG